MQIPFWNDASLQFEELCDNEMAEFVKISKDDSLKYSLRNARILKVEIIDDKKVHQVVESFSGAENLRAFDFSFVMKPPLVSALARNFSPKIEQIGIAVHDCTEESMLELFRAMKCAHLTAVNLCLLDTEMAEFNGKHLIEALNDDYLQCIELSSYDREFDLQFFESIQGRLKNLRTFWHGRAMLDAQLAKSLRSALEQMPRLTALNVSFEKDLEATDEIKSFLLSSPCPLQHLQLGLDRLKKEVVISFLEVIRLGTRLRSLWIDEFKICWTKEKYLMPLLNEGWLVAFDSDYKNAPAGVVAAMARNRRRHKLCQRTCLTLLVVRKRKRALTSTAYEIVVMIARYLWHTRNRAEWGE